MLWLWLSAAMAAEPAVLVGTVSDYPVRIVLPGAQGPGSLTYIRKNARLGLSGTCGAPCALTELGPDGRPTGAIAATWSSAGLSLTGTWETPDHTKKLPFAAAGGPDAAVVWARAAVWPRGAGAHKTEPVRATLPAILVVDPAVQAKLDALASPQRLIGDPQEQIIADGWVNETRYETALNRAGVLALVVYVDGSGAYPDQFTRTLTVDTHTGAEIGLEAFTAAGRTALVAAVDAEVQRRKRSADPEVADLIANVHFDDASLAGFYPTPEGLVFRVSWGFPHAIEAMEPDSLVVIPWATCIPAIAPGSPLLRAGLGAK